MAQPHTTPHEAPRGEQRRRDKSVLTHADKLFPHFLSSPYSCSQQFSLGRLTYAWSVVNYSEDSKMQRQLQAVLVPWGCGASIAAGSLDAGS